jgi:hypothetical protein
MMAHDMHAVSLVQDVGPAVPTPAFIKFQANPALHARKMEEPLACVRGFMNTISLKATASMNDLNDYFRAMAHNRAFGIPGTTHGNGTLWLFMLARELQPKVIVESGVYHGSSLFTFKNAVPQAKMFAFDVNFDTLTYTAGRGRLSSTRLGNGHRAGGKLLGSMFFRRPHQ